MSKALAFLYLAIALVEVFAEVTGHTILRLIFKPLLMPVLVAFFISTAGTLNRVHRLMIAAFFFSWVGDVALMFGHVSENYFLVGLVGFLITHILYTIAFGGVSNKSIKALLPGRIWVLVPLALYMACFISVLAPAIMGTPATKPFLVPVLIYSTAIAVMVVFAVNRYKRVSDKSFALVFGGALLFMFSDSLIAINKFMHPFPPLSHILIMALYITAQYLIARGVLLQFLPVRDKA